MTSNTDYNFFGETIEKLIENKKTVNTRPDVILVISNDQLNEYEITVSEPTSYTSLHGPHETSSNCQSLFLCNDFVKNEDFNTFYEDYVEFKQVSDILLNP